MHLFLVSVRFDIFICTFTLHMVKLTGALRHSVCMRYKNAATSVLRSQLVTFFIVLIFIIEKKK